MALPIHRELKLAFPNAIFRGYDPVADTESIEQHFDFEAVGTLHKAFEDANVVMILNNHKEFQNMELSANCALMAANGIVYDLWNMHNDAGRIIAGGIHRLALGAENARRA